MANGEPMNKAVSDAKAALRRICEEFDVEPEDWKPIEALIERLTAPLDAEEGRELVGKLKVCFASWWNGVDECVEHEPVEEAREAAAYIERQAARIAALTAIPEEVEGLAAQVEEWCERLREMDRQDTENRSLGAYLASINLIYHLHGSLRAYAAREADRAWVDAPVDMLLFCPNCDLQHIDAPDERTPDWTNPPHKSHLCHGCGHIWRPSDRPTNGVFALKTFGQKDGSPRPAKPAPGLAKLRREVEALGRGQIDTAGAMAINAVLALIDREQEAGDA